MGMAVVQKMGGKLVFRFEIGYRPSEGRIGSQGFKNAGIFESS